jgi:hypothetical protein
MKLKRVAFFAASVIAVACAQSASAAIFIATQVNGGGKNTQASGTSAAAWSGTASDYVVTTASGSTGVAPTLLNSVILVTKISTSANTLDIWLTETGLTSFTGKMTNGFTENLLPAGWTVTETTYYSASNALYGGTQIASHAFVSNEAVTVPTAQLAITGPFSLTHRYTIGAASLGTTLSTITLADPPAVPEPATWALMLGGFGLAGTALRRRSAKAALAA